MDLYTVSFTTKKKVHKYDAKGNLTSTTDLENPVVITALPHKTAMSYSGNDNFRINPYIMDQPRRRKTTKAEHAWGDAATKKVDRSVERSETSKRKPKSSSKSKVQHAAQTGDLSAAING